MHFSCRNPRAKVTPYITKWRRHTDTSRTMVTARYLQGSYKCRELHFITLPDKCVCSGVIILMLGAILNVTRQWRKKQGRVKGR